MSVMRNEQVLGRYSSGNASGHHHVVWLLNGHHVPGREVHARAVGVEVERLVAEDQPPDRVHVGGDVGQPLLDRAIRRVTAGPSRACDGVAGVVGAAGRGARCSRR